MKTILLVNFLDRSATIQQQNIMKYLLKLFCKMYTQWSINDVHNQRTACNTPGTNGVWVLSKNKNNFHHSLGLKMPLFFSPGNSLLESFHWVSGRIVIDRPDGIGMYYFGLAHSVSLCSASVVMLKAIFTVHVSFSIIRQVDSTSNCSFE